MNFLSTTGVAWTVRPNMSNGVHTNGDSGLTCDGVADHDVDELLGRIESLSSGAQCSLIDRLLPRLSRRALSIAAVRLELLTFQIYRLIDRFIGEICEIFPFIFGEISIYRFF